MHTFYQFSPDEFTVEPINGDFTANSTKIHFRMSCTIHTSVGETERESELKWNYFSNLICVVDDVRAHHVVFFVASTKMHETHCKLNNYYTWYISWMLDGTSAAMAESLFLSLCVCVFVRRVQQPMYTAKQCRETMREKTLGQFSVRKW